MAQYMKEGACKTPERVPKFRGDPKLRWLGRFPLAPGRLHPSFDPPSELSKLLPDRSEA